MGIYLDYAATTPVEPTVLEATLPYFREHFANPSSLHRPGQRARRAVEEARERVAAAIGATPREIVFTGGATEADNQAVLLGAGGLITSRLEHAAVLAAARFLEARGTPVRYLAPDAAGAITPEALKEALEAQPNTALVALMLVNNETGVRTDIPAMSALAREAGALLFCDAVQGFGYEPIEVAALGVDLLSLSGHKVGGPKGVGVLYIRDGVSVPPLLRGGEQERGQRPGTHNVPAIVGMGAAAELAASRLPDAAALAERRDWFEARLLAVPGVRVNGASAPRGPKHASVQVAGVDGESLLVALDGAGIYVSAGSACAAGSLEPSHVLTGMGLSRAEAKASVRFSLAHGVTDAALETAAARFGEVVAALRAVAA